MSHATCQVHEDHVLQRNFDIWWRGSKLSGRILFYACETAYYSSERKSVCEGGIQQQRFCRICYMAALQYLASSSMSGCFCTIFVETDCYLGLLMHFAHFGQWSYKILWLYYQSFRW